MQIFISTLNWLHPLITSPPDDKDLCKMNSILKANLMFCSVSTKFLVRLYQLSRFKFRLTQAVLKYLNIAMLPGQKIHFHQRTTGHTTSTKYIYFLILSS